jgi:hypothetical protein
MVLPNAISFDPVDGATNVSTALKFIQITFESTSIDPADAAVDVTMAVDVVGGTNVYIQPSISGDVCTFYLLTFLQSSTRYKASIRRGALVQNWTFTTTSDSESSAVPVLDATNLTKGFSIISGGSVSDAGIDPSTSDVAGGVVTGNENGIRIGSHSGSLIVDSVTKSVLKNVLTAVEPLMLAAETSARQWGTDIALPARPASKVTSPLQPGIYSVPSSFDAWYQFDSLQSGDRIQVVIVVNGSLRIHATQGRNLVNTADIRDNMVWIVTGDVDVDANVLIQGSIISMGSISLGAHVLCAGVLVAQESVVLQSSYINSSIPWMNPITRAFFQSGLEDRGAESTIGHLITDAFLWYCHEKTTQSANLALMIPGGIRSDLTKTSDLTITDVVSVLPFSSTLVVITLTGSELIQVMRNQIRPGSRPFLHLSVSGNVQVVMNPEVYTLRTNQSQLLGLKDTSISSMMVNGELVSPSKLYKVVLPETMAQGVDSFINLPHITASSVSVGASELLSLCLYLKSRNPDYSPDYARRTKFIGSPLPLSVKSGDEVSISLKHLQMTSLQCPSDTSVTVSFKSHTGVTTAFNTPFPVTAESDSTVTLTIPDGLKDDGMMQLIASPSGTTVMVPLVGTPKSDLTLLVVLITAGTCALVAAALSVAFSYKRKHPTQPSQRI